MCVSHDETDLVGCKKVAYYLIYSNILLSSVVSNFFIDMLVITKYGFLRTLLVDFPLIGSVASD